jgi:hypothetical protein
VSAAPRQPQQNGLRSRQESAAERSSCPDRTGRADLACCGPGARAPPGGARPAVRASRRRQGRTPPSRWSPSTTRAEGTSSGDRAPGATGTARFEVEERAVRLDVSCGP